MKGKKFLDTIEENFIAAGIIVMVIMETINAICRNLIPTAGGIPEEIAIFVYIWVCFFCAAFCAKTGCNVVVDLMSGKFSKNIQRYLKLFEYVIDGILSVLFLIGAVTFVNSTWVGGSVGVTGIPHWIIYTAPIIGFSLNIFRNIQNCKIFFTSKES